MYASINGARIFFDITGLQYVPDGPTMREKPVCFCLHGGPGASHASLLPALLPLAEDMQLVFIDDRNAGLSSHGDVRTSTIKQHVDDAEALRKYLGLGKIFILGISYGGMKAQRYIIDYPDSLYGAIIASTSPSWRCLSYERLLYNVKRFGNAEQIAMFENDYIHSPEYDAVTYNTVFGPLYHGKGCMLDENGNFNTKAHVDGLLRSKFGNNPGNEVTRFMNSPEGDLSHYDFLEELKTVRVPALCIAGENDFVTDEEYNRDMAEAIPGAEYHVIKDGSHSVFSDYPDITFNYIRNFIKRTYKPEQ